MENNINWSSIDKVVYINLASRPTRKAEICQELKTINIPEDKIYHFNAIADSNGTLGCAKSHREVLIIAKRAQWDNVLILEDDMVFDKSVETTNRVNLFFNKLFSLDSWDVAFLSGSYFIVHTIEPYFLRVNFSYLANSYLVSSNYYQKLIDNYDESIEAIESGEYVPHDANWMKLMEKDNWYGIYPCAGYQRIDHSSIQNIVTDRTEFFKRTIDEMRQFGST